MPPVPREGRSRLSFSAFRGFPSAVYVVATLDLFLVSPVFPAYRAPILSAFETFGYTVSASLADLLVLGVAVAAAGFSARAKTGNAT